MAIVNELIRIVPHERQIVHQSMEFYGFFHFTVNTFTGKEWGDGTESPEIFNPARMNASQWVCAAKAAGMTGVILTCKHHDGFCLWPSRYTEHSVASSPYRSGKGDIVREVSEACREQGLKFGIYLSPWDRNQPVYGTGKEYDDYFINQLTELLTGYGDIFCVWLDGACGEGKNGRVQKYDWQRYYACIRRLQPGACISVCGPDVRWCGNEAGDVRKSEWSVVSAGLADAEAVQEKSQQEDNTEFRARKISSSMQDLGSREALEAEKNLIWYPAEVNTSIRPGWFYHPEEDGQVKSLEELLRIYYGSVGGNATFLLNVPPMPSGLLHDRDVERLQELGDYLRQAFQNNLMEEARLQAFSESGEHGIENVRNDDYDTWYQAKEGESGAEIVITFHGRKRIRHIVLKENIRLSQRIEQFEIFADRGEGKEKIYEGTVVGYKKIIPLYNVCCEKLYISVLESRECPNLSFIGVYE